MGIYPGKKKMVAYTIDTISFDFWITSDHWWE
jgi:hypothetical protein